MSRKFAPFEVVVHYSGRKTKKELQKYINEFYIQKIHDRLYNSNLSYEEKIATIDHLVELHKPKSQP